MDIFLLRVKLGRVAEGGRSILSSISLRSTVAPHTCYMGVDDLLDLIIGFYYPTLPLDELKTTLPLFQTFFYANSEYSVIFLIRGEPHS